MCCLLEQRALAWEKFKIKHEMKISKCFDQDRVTNTHILQIVTNGSLKSTQTHLFEEAAQSKTQSLQPSPKVLLQTF